MNDTALVLLGFGGYILGVVLVLVAHQLIERRWHKRYRAETQRMHEAWAHRQDLPRHRCPTCPEGLAHRAKLDHYIEGLER